MTDKPRIYWAQDVREEIGAALITAQTGYFQLSNGPDMVRHHQCAQQALDTVTEAIRHGKVLEQQGIVESRGRGR